MTHPDIGPELRRLAQKILEQIDPAVRLAAARAVGDGAGTGTCQQVWCPVCALAAVVTGDEHPLLTVIAEHSVALLGVIRAIVDQVDRPAPPPPDGPPDGSGTANAADKPAPTSRYQPITVTVEE
ncbi:hypothetical protein A5658_02465 [Mycobacterium sp. 1245111.1]|uniref:hypothetical protein n=1 Tax=Mycobacterium sp. 1245111.1 TaxID=1834073 RepID=UPI000800832F|nr:hypothetical protein [Mycobacterium sp. 1245111.1]OBK41913.1 hypothetical protein A5658_02465 [Mycobacterium sp. 1245111.1]